LLIVFKLHDALFRQDDPAFMALVDKLAAEPISPDEKAALLHKYEQADEDTRVSASLGPLTVSSYTDFNQYVLRSTLAAT
jgi:hypothetical protein